MKRRQFLGNMLTVGGGIIVASNFSSVFASIRSSKPDGKLGVALVGLGRYSSGELAPALQETKHCYLAGIVTGTPSKEQDWARRYNIPAGNIYNYKNFDTIANNKDIDIVYVVLPNSMHAEYVIRAAQAGKHVICEKPMANSVEECQMMINACNTAGKKLSIGYRLYFDPFHRKMMELGQHQVYGKISQIDSGFAFTMRNPNEWRINKKLSGGGPLVDLGIYSVEGSIYTAGELPSKVTARNTTRNKDFFKDVEGSMEFELMFPSGFTSKCITSYESNANSLKISAEKGTFELFSAFSYGGIQGRTPEGSMNLKPVNQQALQMDAFAQCIKDNKPSIVPGELGMRDVFIIRKLYEAMETGKTVSLQGIPTYNYKV